MIVRQPNTSKISNGDFELLQPVMVASGFKPLEVLSANTGSGRGIIISAICTARQVLPRALATFPPPSSPQVGRSPDEIKPLWRASCLIGNRCKRARFSYPSSSAACACTPVGPGSDSRSAGVHEGGLLSGPRDSERGAAAVSPGREVRSTRRNRHLQRHVAGVRQGKYGKGVGGRGAEKVPAARCRALVPDVTIRWMISLRLPACLYLRVPCASWRARRARTHLACCDAWVLAVAFSPVTTRLQHIRLACWFPSSCWFSSSGMRPATMSPFFPATTRIWSPELSTASAPTTCNGFLSREI